MSICPNCDLRHWYAGMLHTFQRLGSHIWAAWVPQTVGVGIREILSAATAIDRLKEEASERSIKATTIH